MVPLRIRDFIITHDNWIFAVVDYFHKDGVRAILRYVPDDKGDRIRKGIRYKKYDFGDAFDFLHAHKPEWIDSVHVVPIQEIKEIFHPYNCIKELLKTNNKVASIVKTLQKKNIALCDMGVTGSLLVGLETESSDIDFVVYGDSWFKAANIISKAKLKSGVIEEISDSMWQQIYNKRIPELSFDEFILHEKRKGNRGMVNGTYFDLLFVRDESQINKPTQYGKKIGNRMIEAIVTNADFSFDSPSIYEIDHKEIDKVISFTHTYAGQARVGELIEVRGVVEEVKINAGIMRQLIVGTSREPKNEWIRSLSLIESNKC